MVQNNTSNENPNNVNFTDEEPAILANVAQTYRLAMEKYVKVGDLWNRADAEGIELLPEDGIVEFRIVGWNVGTEVLRNVTVEDPALGFIEVIDELASGESAYFASSADGLTETWQKKLRSEYRHCEQRVRRNPRRFRLLLRRQSID